MCVSVQCLRLIWCVLIGCPSRCCLLGCYSLRLLLLLLSLWKIWLQIDNRKYIKVDNTVIWCFYPHIVIRSKQIAVFTFPTRMGWVRTKQNREKKQRKKIDFIGIDGLRHPSVMNTMVACVRDLIHEHVLTNDKRRQWYTMGIVILWMIENEHLLNRAPNQQLLCSIKEFHRKKNNEMKRYDYWLKIICLTLKVL